jgi:hypothetical protein
VVASAERRRYAGIAIASDRAVEAATAARPTLSGEQEAMVRTICGSGAGVDIVEGVAGAGKTFALASARDAWEPSGYRVIGCSLAARAAKQLQDDAASPPPRSTGSSPGSNATRRHSTKRLCWSSTKPRWWGADDTRH